MNYHKHHSKNEHDGCNRYNIFSNQVIFYITFMICICVSQASISTNDRQNKLNCSIFRACSKCAEQMDCYWSFDKQECYPTKKSIVYTQAAIFTEDNCPKFFLTRNSAKMNVNFNSMIEIHNDHDGRFSNIINNANSLLCYYGQKSVYAHFKDHKYIICKDMVIGANDLEKLITVRFRVVFDGVQLQFDDLEDNYFTVFDQYCGRRDDRCVTCLWDELKTVNYWKLCSTRNSCSGAYEYFDETIPGSLSGSETPNQTVTIDGARCPDVRVQSVKPTSGPLTGDTVLEITVKNHEMLTDGGARMVSVSVAGRVCEIQMALAINNETIVCTVAGTGDREHGRPVKGPVRVVYQWNRAYAIESEQMFRFVRPAVTAVSPACGPLEGGTLLTVRGVELDAGRVARVIVTGNRTCETIVRYSDRILCRTDVAAESSVGAVEVEFDQQFSNRIVSNVSFAYAGDALVNFEQPQQLVSIASGGTVLRVSGEHLACVRNATAYVLLNGTKNTADCFMIDDSRMECRSPSLSDAFLESVVVNSWPLRLRLGFKALTATGHVVDLNVGPDALYLTVHKDPMFQDFVVIAGSDVVIINTHHSVDHGGYRVEDVVVQMPHSKGNCTVVSVKHNYIECRCGLASATHAIRLLKVAIGDQFTCDVHRKLSIINVSYYYVGATVILTAMSMAAVIAFHKNITSWVSKIQRVPEFRSM